MKRRIAALSATFVTAGCVMFRCTGCHESEVLLSSNLTLKSDWQEIRGPRVLRTEALSKVLLEMPNVRLHSVGDQVLLDDGTKLQIDAYLTTDADERITLDMAGVETFAGRTVLWLSTDALRWKRRDYRFRVLGLRSDKSVETGKVIWLSYDPRETKDGVVFPRALQ